MRLLRRRPPAEEDCSHKKDLLMAACAQAVIEAGNVNVGELQRFHLTAADIFENHAKAIDMVAAPSDADETAWVVYRLARAYLNIPLVSTR